MANRSRLLYEISQALQLNPPATSTVELKRRYRLPKKFQSLKSLEQLQSLLDWINDGMPEIPEEPKKYRRRLDRERAIELIRSQPLASNAVIGRELGVTGTAIANLKKELRERSFFVKLE